MTGFHRLDVIDPEEEWHFANDRRRVRNVRPDDRQDLVVLIHNCDPKGSHSESIDEK